MTGSSSGTESLASSIIIDDNCVSRDVKREGRSEAMYSQPQSHPSAHLLRPSFSPFAPSLGLSVSPVHLLLEGMRHGQHGGIVEMTLGEHEAYRQTVGLRAGNTDRGMSSHIKRHSIAQHVPAMRNEFLDPKLWPIYAWAFMGVVGMARTPTCWRTAS